MWPDGSPLAFNRPSFSHRLSISVVTPKVVNLAWLIVWLKLFHAHFPQPNRRITVTRLGLVWPLSSMICEAEASKALKLPEKAQTRKGVQ